MKRKLNFLVIFAFFFGLIAIQYGCSSSKNVPTKQDSDHDGLLNKQEMSIGTNPHNPDTDGDGLSDGEEVNKYGTNPTSADTDGDGLSDGDEVHSYNTNPNQPDTDGDGLNDGQEINRYHTNPLKADSDSDGITDGEEINMYGTDPLNPDSDGDGISDGQEIRNGSDPTDPNSPPHLTDSDMMIIHFKFDKSNITDQAAQKLMHNVQELMGAPNYDVRIDAYTDYVGSDQYNLRLSIRRATSVAKFYKNKGIPGNRIRKRGLGQAPQPCLKSEMDENTPGCRKNRRAESHPVKVG